jgi:Tfp pilus assembly major pilin PilA
MVVLMTQDFQGVNREIVEAITNDMGDSATRQRASSCMCRLRPTEEYTSSTSGRVRQIFRPSPTRD